MFVQAYFSYIKNFEQFQMYINYLVVIMLFYLVMWTIFSMVNSFMNWTHLLSYCSGLMVIKSSTIFSQIPKLSDHSMVFIISQGKCGRLMVFAMFLVLPGTCLMFFRHCWLKFYEASHKVCSLCVDLQSGINLFKWLPLLKKTSQILKY